ncbi:MAG: cyclic nucleotide-binding domain-containing protein, partial [Deltaproteobacteria bacterium]|nr:cyclic nucleotide-binding domain-containing protein [Deltaproteobacteria bacterium]
MKPLAILQEIDIFQPFSEEAKSYLSERMRRHHFPSGAIIVRQDDSANSLFIVAEGVVGVRMYGEGGTLIEIARIEAGNVFGERSLLTGAARTATFMSATDTELFELTREDITPVIKEHPEIYQLLSEILTQRIITARSHRNDHQAPQTPEEHLVKHILLDRVIGFFSKRKHSRVKVRKDINITISVRESGTQQFVAEVEDITTGGLSFFCASMEYPLRRGDRVNIELHAVNLIDKPIAITGIIRYRVEALQVEDRKALQDKYGLQFDMLSQSQIEQIDRLVNYIHQEHHEKKFDRSSR